MRLNSGSSFFAFSAVLLVAIPLAAQEEVHKDVPYVPTPPEVVEAMLKLGNAKTGDIHYDLGCGDGRIVVMAVQSSAPPAAPATTSTPSASPRPTPTPRQPASPIR